MPTRFPRPTADVCGIPLLCGPSSSPAKRRGVITPQARHRNRRSRAIEPLAKLDQICGLFIWQAF